MIGREFPHAQLAVVAQGREPELRLRSTGLADAATFSRCAPHATWSERTRTSRTRPTASLREPRRSPPMAQRLESQFPDTLKASPSCSPPIPAPRPVQSRSCRGPLGYGSAVAGVGSALVEAAEHSARALTQIEALPGTARAASRADWYSSRSLRRSCTSKGLNA